MSLSMAFTVDSLTVRIALTLARTGLFLTWKAWSEIPEPAQSGEFMRGARFTEKCA